MIKVDNIDVWGFEHAVRGMRNPLNSWNRSDSEFYISDVGCDIEKIGPNDLDLMQRLYSAGTEHRKYLRQIFVSMDITAPLYWWKEFDTYKIGTTANSCSTMHKITSKDFTIEDFSFEHLKEDSIDLLEKICQELNEWRYIYLNGNELFERGDKEIWWQLIQLLPSSYNQKRTVTMNYENVIQMIKQRTNHKLDEWNNFVVTLKDLPYIKEITE